MVVCGAALLIAAAVVVASRNRRQPALPSEVPAAVLVAEVRVKAVGRKAEPVGKWGVSPFGQYPPASNPSL